MLCLFLQSLLALHMQGQFQISPRTFPRVANQQKPQTEAAKMHAQDPCSLPSSMQSATPSVFSPRRKCNNIFALFLSREASSRIRELRYLAGAAHLGTLCPPRECHKSRCLDKQTRHSKANLSVRMGETILRNKFPEANQRATLQTGPFKVQSCSVNSFLYR